MHDGLMGPIIVHPTEEEPFEYDEEVVLFLSDFYIQTSDQQVIGLQNYPFTWVGNPDSLLINGKGVAAKCQEGGEAVDHAGACLSTCNDTLPLLETITVEAGKTYRFRVING